MNCQSRCYMIRDRDGAGVVYRCYRGWPHPDRPHQAGINSDAGKWTTRSSLVSLWWLHRHHGPLVLPRMVSRSLRDLFGGAA